MPTPPSSPTPRGRIARVLLAAALAIGYADLARGGSVVAALALVAAYVILAPAALLLD